MRSSIWSVSRTGPAAEADIMPSGPRRREQRPTGLAGLGELRGSETKVAVSRRFGGGRRKDRRRGVAHVLAVAGGDGLDSDTARRGMQCFQSACARPCTLERGRTRSSVGETWHRLDPAAGFARHASDSGGLGRVPSSTSKADPVAGEGGSGPLSREKTDPILAMVAWKDLQASERCARPRDGRVSTLPSIAAVCTAVSVASSGVHVRVRVAVSRTENAART